MPPKTNQDGEKKKNKAEFSTEQKLHGRKH